MSVSIREVIEAAGYDLSTPEGAQWLVAQEDLFDEMIEEAEEVVEAEEERLSEIEQREMEAEEQEAEARYRERFPEDEE